MAAYQPSSLLMFWKGTKKINIEPGPEQVVMLETLPYQITREKLALKQDYRSMEC
jgi:hypothetical protein